MTLQWMHPWWFFAVCLLRRYAHAETFTFDTVVMASPNMGLIRTVYLASGDKPVRLENCFTNVTNSALKVVLFPWDAKSALESGKNGTRSIGHCKQSKFALFPEMLETAFVLDYEEAKAFKVSTRLDGPYVLAIANCGAATVHVSGRFSTNGLGGHETEMVPVYCVFAVLFGALAITWFRFTDASCSLRQDDIWHVGFVTRVSFLMVIVGLIRFLLQTAAIDEVVILDSIHYAATVVSATSLPLAYLSSCSNQRPPCKVVFAEIVLAICIYPVFRNFKSSELDPPSTRSAYGAVAIFAAMLIMAAVRSCRTINRLEDEEIELMTFYRYLGLGALVYAVGLNFSVLAFAFDDPREGAHVWRRHTIAHGLFLSTQFIGLVIIIGAWRRHLRFLDVATKEQPYDTVECEDEDDETGPLWKENGVSAAVIGNPDSEPGMNNDTSNALESGVGVCGLDDKPLE